jgi:hypothetical protein
MHMEKSKLTPERCKEIFYAALEHTEGFRNACRLTCADVYGGFEEWLHRSLDGNWQVVGVTRDAAAALVQSGFDMKLVQRAHRMRRLDRYEAMIALPGQEQYDFFMAQDKVTLTTRAENHKNGTNHWSEVLPIPDSIGRLGGSFRSNFIKSQLIWRKEF